MGKVRACGWPLADSFMSNACVGLERSCGARNSAAQRFPNRVLQVLLLEALGGTWQGGTVKYQPEAPNLGEGSPPPRCSL